MSVAMKFIVVLFGMSAVEAATAQTKEDPKGPMDKVVELLEELQAGMERDQKADQGLYDKYACWCEETTGKYAEAIKKSQADIERLGTLILEKKGEIAVLSAEIEKLTQEIADNEESQAKATSIRSKENEAFMAEKIELEQAIAALEKAITVLSGAGTGKTGLLQGGTSTFERIKVVAGLKTALRALPARVGITPKQLAAVEKLSTVEVEEPSAPDEAAASYSPQSATIQGILKDMYDTMSGDLETQTNNEASKQRAFEDLIAELKESLKNMQEELRSKEQKKAEAEQILADASQELDDTSAQLKADIEFFDNIKAGCVRKAEEWSERNQGYNDELEGIKKALEILTSDDAKELFGKAIKPGKETGAFMQVFMTGDMEASAPRNKAYAALKDAASKSKSLRLASVASTVRMTETGHFDKVISKIDDMIAELKQETQDDITKRDTCKKEYQELAMDKAEIEWLIKKNEAMVVKIEDTIAKIQEAIEDTQKAMAETKKQLEDMEKERTEENQAFIDAKTDDQNAIKLIEQAIEALSAYYKDNKIEMGPIQGSSKLLQEGEPEFDKGDQPPDAEFKKKGHKKNESKGIISIMTMIKEDLEDEIKNGIKSEVAAQKAYEEQVDAANALLDTLKAKETNLEEDKAKQEDALLDEHTDMENNKKDLDTNTEKKEAITEDCDWMIENFKERGEKRKLEMDGLVKAKEFLAGASPSGFLQHSSV